MTAAPVRAAVVVFPGSNCEHDVAHALARLGADVSLVWHTDDDLGPADVTVIPGGFAHGDYLRPGALARFSPVMAAVGRAALDGMPVLGICNGFQILTEAALLPGTLHKNRDLKFLCGPCEVEVTSTAAPLTRDLEAGRRLQVPINHFSGAYRCDDDTLGSLVEGANIVLRYVRNPNGSTADIAGISSAEGNVVGLMPHPERACDPLGATDGAPLLASFLAAGADRAGAGR